MQDAFNNSVSRLENWVLPSTPPAIPNLCLMQQL